MNPACKFISLQSFMAEARRPSERINWRLNLPFSVTNCLENYVFNFNLSLRIFAAMGIFVCFFIRSSLCSRDRYHYTLSTFSPLLEVAVKFLDTKKAYIFAPDYADIIFTPVCANKKSREDFAINQTQCIM